jgi:peptide/nickel transport system permease protein
MTDALATPSEEAVLESVDATGRRAQHADWRRLMHDTLRKRRTQVGLVMSGLVIAVAIFGPLLTTTSPTAFVGSPYEAPTKGLPFGCDYLGRDVLSRFLHGGLRLLLVALLATAVGVVTGALLGLVAGYSGKKTDETIMRLLDVVLSFPAIILALLFVSALGNKWWLVVLTIGLSHTPRVARVVRGATVTLIEQDYVHYAEGIGVPRRQIIFSDLLPNVTAPLTVEFGLRMSYSVALVAALAYLGFGTNPPNPDWGTMIYENQLGITLNAWGVLLPVLAIATLTIGLNLVTDGFGQAVAGVDRGLDLDDADTGRRRRGFLGIGRRAGARTSSAAPVVRQSASSPTAVETANVEAAPVEDQ